MSNLTKVFALLVSLLSIFLCGVVVVYVGQSQNWKQLCQEQKAIAQAAQVQAMAAEAYASSNNQAHKAVTQRLKETITSIQRFNSDLSGQLAQQKQDAAINASQAQTAVQTVSALRETIQNMYDAQLAIQQALNDDRTRLLATQTQMIELTRQMNDLQATGQQLKAIRKQQIEQIYMLEEENQRLRSQSEQVTLSSSRFQDTSDRVTLTPPAPQANIPIRGQVTDIQGEKVALSIGSSSGVREDMMFWVTRGDEFLGNIRIVYVESGEAVGQLSNQQGVIVTGDSITSGFEF